MSAEVEYIKFYFEGEVNDIRKRTLSSAVWKNLYNLFERGGTPIDYVMVKKSMQDAYFTFSDMYRIGNKSYILYFMSPNPRVRFDVINAMKNGIKIGRRKLRLVDVDIRRFTVGKKEVYVTLSPIIVTRNGEYYMPPEIEWFKNLLGYMEIKYYKHTGGKHINLKKDNFKITELYYIPRKINFQKYHVYGVDIGFELKVNSGLLKVLPTLIELGFGTKSGLGYGFVLPKKVLVEEEIEHTVLHPVYASKQKYSL